MLGGGNNNSLNPFFRFFAVCSTPGQGQLPPSLFPRWRDQQAEAHWTADGPLPYDLTSNLSFTTGRVERLYIVCELLLKQTKTHIQV